MYKFTCNDIGFECDFIIKNSEKKVIINDFCKHLLVKHNQFFPAREIFDLVEKQDEERRTDRIEKCELLKLEKWSLGRRNFS